MPMNESDSLNGQSPTFGYPGPGHFDIYLLHDLEKIHVQPGSHLRVMKGYYPL